MSWELTGLVSKKLWGGQTRRLVALTLADKANDDGTGIYASVRTMARLSEVSEATARRTMQAFEADGILTKVGERPCTNGYTNVYELSVARIEALPDLRPPKGSDAPVTVRPVSARNPKIKGQANGPDTKETAITVRPVAQCKATPVTVTDKPIHEPIPLDKSKGDMPPAAMRKAAVDAYNIAASAHGWRKCCAADELSDQRRRKLDTHLRKRGGIAGWMRDLAAMEAQRWMDGDAKRKPGHENWRFSLDAMFQGNFRNTMDDFAAQRPASADPLAEERWACTKRAELGRWPGGYSEASIGPIVRAEYPQIFANGSAARLAS